MYLHSDNVNANFDRTIIWHGATDSLGRGTAYSDPSSAGVSKCERQVNIPNSGVVGFSHIDNPNAADPPSYDLYCLFDGGDDPPFAHRVGGVSGGRICPDGAAFDNGTETCFFPDNRRDPNKEGGCPQPSAGNPIALFSEEKIQIEEDFSGTSTGTLPIRRWYHNRGARQESALGINAWRLERYSLQLFSNFDPLTEGLITLEPEKSYWVYVNNAWWSSGGSGSRVRQYPIPSAEIIKWNGKVVEFARDASGVWLSETGSVEKLFEYWDGSSFLGWKFIDSNEDTYIFDIQKRLQEIARRNGSTEYLIYELSSAEGGDDNALTLDKVEDDFGRSLQFLYLDNRIITIQDSEGGLYGYSYSADNLLETVSYPDGDLNPSNNPVRTYHYSDNGSAHYLNLLGITDERGVRYANWSYEGFIPVTSHHGSENGEVEKVVIDYSGLSSPTASIGAVEMTNSLGNALKYHFTTSLNSRRLTHVERSSFTHPVDTSVGCDAADQYYSYDAKGFLNHVTDWEGNVTDYDHNDRGLEVSRTEGLRWDNDQVNATTVTTPEMHTITTEWHPKFRLETRIREPEMVTDFVYDCDNGRLLEKKVWEPVQAPVYVAPVCS